MRYGTRHVGVNCRVARQLKLERARPGAVNIACDACDAL